MHRPLVLLALVCVLGCTDAASDDSFGVVALASLADATHDVVDVRITVVEAGNTCSAGPAVIVDLAGLESTPLPESVGSGDNHPYAHALYTLPPGDYLVCGEPLDANQMPSAQCAVAGPVPSTVVGGQTTEVTLWSQCLGEDNAGLDIIGGLNGKPVIDDVNIRPSKWIRLCEPAIIDLDVDHIDGDEEQSTFAWSISAGPTGALLEGDRTHATFTPTSVGDYDIHIAVNDQQGGQSELTFPIHVRDHPCTFERRVGIIEDLAVDAEDHIITIGLMTVSDFDIPPTSPAPVEPSGSFHAVAKLTPGGESVWIKPFGRFHSFAARDPRVEVDANGDILILLSYGNAGLDIGCGAIPIDGADTYPLLAKLSGETGACLWQFYLQGGNQHQVGADLAIAPGTLTSTSDDTILLAIGDYDAQHSELPDGTPLTLTPDHAQLIALRADGAFHYLAEYALPPRVPPAVESNEVTRVTVGIDGTAFVHYTTFDDGRIGAIDVATGDLLWSMPFDDSSRKVQLVTDDAGDVLVGTNPTANMDPGVSFSHGALSFEAPNASAEVIILRFDAATGDTLWATQSHSQGDAELFDMIFSEGEPLLAVSEDATFAMPDSSGTDIARLHPATGAVTGLVDSPRQIRVIARDSEGYIVATHGGFLSKLAPLAP